MSESKVTTRRQLGGYEVLRALRSGGMGQVLLARKLGAGGFEQLVAVKTMRGDLAGLDSVRRMFHDEARLVARLRHPVIAQVLDFGDDADTLYLAMEYVAGVSFRDLIELAPPPAICARAMAEVCRGLHAAHELTDLAGRPLGVVHRDVSPENLMLTFEGRIKVLDFGIALMRGRQAPVTEYGAIKGKPPYLSPEQLRSDALDRRSDIFSAAVVLHELLTGRPVYAGDSVFSIARAMEHHDVPPPSALAGPLPAGLDEVALRGLAREPRDRYPTALAMAQALDAVAGAAGAEHLEEYAQHALADRAAQHRAMLAEALHEPDRPRVAPGRDSDAMTALSADAGAPAQEPASRATHRVDGGGDPALADPLDGAKAVRVRARTRQVTLAISLAVSLALVVGTAWHVSSDRSPRPGTKALGARIEPADASADAPRSAVTPPEHPSTAPVDAALARTPPDAGPAAEPPRADRDRAPRRSRQRPREAGRAERPTAQEPASRSAPAKPVSNPDPEKPRAPASSRQPEGESHLTITAEPWGHVQLDGASIGPTPVFRRRVSAGAHEVVITRPDDGAVRLRKTVDLTPGEHLHVRAP